MKYKNLYNKKEYIILNLIKYNKFKIIINIKEKKIIIMKIKIKII